MRFSPFLLLLACDSGRIQAECEDMCLAGTLLYGACLQDWGLDWFAVGYEGAQGHLDACRTWSWEQSIFEKEALKNGLIETSGWLENTCEQGAQLFQNPEASCNDYTGFSWLIFPGVEEASL